MAKRGNDDDMYESFDFDSTDFEYAMGRGKQRRQTKEQHIYGAFLDAHDDDRPSFSGNKTQRGNYTTPVSFISGGVKMGGRVEQEGVEKHDSDDGEDVPAEGGEGAAQKEEDMEVLEARPEKKGAPTSHVGRKPKAGANVIAGMRTSAHHATSFDLGTGGAWTKASGKSDVIMNIMRGMGYQPGKGLGANKQGIVEPVVSKVRPGRGAVGAYGKEQQGPKFGESASEAQARIHGGDVEEGPQKGTSSREGWKKTNAPRKVKIHYKTIDEVISEGDADRFLGGGRGSGSGTLGKIIDMTGPEQRVYDNFSSFSSHKAMSQASDVNAQPAAGKRQFDVPELMHNLNSLLDMTEEEIRRSDRELRLIEDQTEVLHGEKQRLAVKVAEERDEVSRMVQVAEIIQRFDEVSSSRAPTLDECKSLFHRLRTQYALEYQLYELDSLAVACVLPLTKSHFAEWDPLDPEQCRFGHALVAEWREILSPVRRSGGPLFDGSSRRGSADGVYGQCIWEGWMPSVRRAAQTWQPRNNSPAMMNFLETWHPLLPHWIAENLLELVIVPRIKEQVDAWDPLVDVIPIDSWLLQWSGVLGDRLLLVYSVIRQKLAKGLRAWLPGDPSALQSLLPWRSAFAPGVMQTFLGMNIVPKMERALQAISISTTEQFASLELFEWMELLSADTVCQMLVKFFFPRLYEGIHARLSVPAVVLASVQAYYKAWKDLFPPVLLEMKPIRDEMTKILMAMHQVQRGLTLPRLHQRQPFVAPIGAAGPSQARPNNSIHAYALSGQSAQSAAGPASFRQLVEQRALQQGILFVPQRNKLYEGKQIYTIGNSSIYFDGTAMFLFDVVRRQWKPTALETLLASCQ